MGTERSSPGPAPGSGVASTAAAVQAGCSAMSDALAAAARGERCFGALENEHLSVCLRCRAEQSRYRRMMEAMRALRDAPPGGDPRMESLILGHLAVHGERFARRARAQAAAAIGGAAAGAAAAAALIALTLRHRRAAVLAH